MSTFIIFHRVALTHFHAHVKTFSLAQDFPRSRKLSTPEPQQYCCIDFTTKARQVGSVCLHYIRITRPTKSGPKIPKQAHYVTLHACKRERHLSLMHFPIDKLPYKFGMWGCTTIAGGRRYLRIFPKDRFND